MIEIVLCQVKIQKQKIKPIISAHLLQLINKLPEQKQTQKTILLVNNGLNKIKIFKAIKQHLEVFERRFYLSSKLIINSFHINYKISNHKMSIKIRAIWYLSQKIMYFHIEQSQLIKNKDKMLALSKEMIFYIKMFLVSTTNQSKNQIFKIMIIINS